MEEEEWGEFSRRDAETRRGFLYVAFSQRLCASAGDGFRYCVEEVLFYRGAGGRDRRRRRGVIFPAETRRRGEVGWFNENSFVQLQVAV